MKNVGVVLQAPKIGQNNDDNSRVALQEMMNSKPHVGLFISH